MFIQFRCVGISLSFSMCMYAYADCGLGTGKGNNYAYLVTDEPTKKSVVIDPANPPE